MATIRDGFSSETYDPVAAPFRGFRAFMIDDLEARRPQPMGARRLVVPDSTFKEGGLAHGAARRGSLRGVFMSDWVWGSGVNRSQCLVSQWGGITLHDPGAVRAECDCGFWAYTNGDHFLSVGGPAALGVVEGWGRVVIGPDGFRSSSARIVALCFPAPRERGDLEPARVTRAIHPAVAYVLAWARLGGGKATGGHVPSAEVQRAARPWEQVDESLRADVRRLYPNAEVFGSVAEMQAAYPLSDLRGLLPEKGADDA